MRGDVKIGATDTHRVNLALQNAVEVQFIATEQGLLIHWGDKNLRWFLKWDYYEAGPPPTPELDAHTSTMTKLQSIREGEKLPGHERIDEQMRRWTREEEGE